MKNAEKHKDSHQDLERWAKARQFHKDKDREKARDKKGPWRQGAAQGQVTFTSETRSSYGHREPPADGEKARDQREAMHTSRRSQPQKGKPGSRPQQQGEDQESWRRSLKQQGGPQTQGSHRD
jgi:hypothetical protein